MKQTWIAIVFAINALMPLMVSAGGPEIEFDAAHIDDVVFDHRGVVLIVTGAAKLYVPQAVDDSPGGGYPGWIAIPAARAEVRYLGGELYAVSYSGQRHYEERIRSLAGTVQHLQLWGTTAVIEGGHLGKVTARVVSELIPVKGERRFAIGRLPELEEEHAAGTNAADQTVPTVDGGPKPER